MAHKLNSIRFLKTHAIAYEVLTCDAAIHDAAAAATAMGVPRDQVYKTPFVKRGSGKPILVMVNATPATCSGHRCTGWIVGGYLWRREDIAHDA